jgi:hypothetical protein
MTWVVIARILPDSTPWVMVEMPFREMLDDLAGEKHVEAILSREDALEHPEYGPAVRAWDKRDATAMEDDMYQLHGLDPEKERAKSRQEAEEIDWSTWEKALPAVETDRALILAYWRNDRRYDEGREDDDTDFWAWETVSGFVDDDPEKAWPIILDLIATSPSEQGIYSVAAGPLEDLVVTHGNRFIDRIEAQAKASPEFKLAIGAAWLTRSDQPDVVTRIDTFLGRPQTS